MEFAASLVLPAVIAALALILVLSRADRYSDFLCGAKEGASTSFSLLPNIVALLVGVSMLGASGFPELASKWLRPLGDAIGIPTELLPLVLVRPLSGSASNAVIIDIFERFGADSFVGLCASVIAGSSETLIYVVSVYFSSVGIKKTRYALPVAFAVMVFGLWLSCRLCALFFGR